MGARTRKGVERRPRIFAGPPDDAGLALVEPQELEPVEPEPKKGKGGVRVQAGRPLKSLMVGSINETFRPFAKVYNAPVWRIVRDAAERIKKRYTLIEAVIEDFDKLKGREKERPLALDNCVTKHMDIEEFKGLIAGFLRSSSKAIADATVTANLPALTEKSIEAALAEDGYKERARHLETHHVIAPPPGQIVNVATHTEVHNSSRTTLAFKPESFEAHMSTLDSILDGGHVKQLPSAREVIDVEVVKENQDAG